MSPVVPIALPAVPAVFAVTVTVSTPFDTAVTTPAALVLMALASAPASAVRFTDAVTLSVLVLNVVPDVVPAVPPLRLPLKAAPVSPDGIVVVTLMLAVPVALAVMVTTPLEGFVAPTPTAAEAPIALAMFVASCAALTAAAPDQR